MLERPIVLRPRTGIFWCIGAWAIGTGAVITQFAGGSPVAALKAIGVLLVVGYGMWLVLCSPSVTLSPSGLVVRNFLRKYEINWTSVLDLPLGMSLSVATRDRKITVAAAPGRGLYQVDSAGAYGRFAGGSPDVAHAVRAYWRTLLSSPPAPPTSGIGPGVKRTWLTSEAIMLVLVVLVTVLAWASFSRRMLTPAQRMDFRFQEKSR